MPSKLFSSFVFPKNVDEGKKKKKKKKSIELFERGKLRSSVVLGSGMGRAWGRVWGLIGFERDSKITVAVLDRVDAKLNSQTLS
jgi:hypothetical protein